MIETLSAREIQEKDNIHSEQRFRELFGSIEKAYEEAGLGTVRDIEEELGEWHRLTSLYPEIEEISEEELVAVYPVDEEL